MWFVLAAVSAIFFGARGILYHWTSQRPINRNLMLLGVYLSGTLITTVTNLFLGQAWTLPVLTGIVMGLFSFIANASIYRGFASGRASIIAILTALPPVLVLIIAFLLWDEKLNMLQGLGFLIIICGVILIRYSNDISLKNLQGIGWGLMALIFFAFTDLSSKQAVMIDAAVIPTLMLMFGTGSMLFGISWLLGLKKEKLQAAGQAVEVTKHAEEAAAIAAQWKPLRTLFWGMTVGISNVGGMMLILPAFKLGVTGLVSVVIAMNVVFVLLYARFWLREKFKRAEFIGLICAFAGVIILRLVS